MLQKYLCLHFPYNLLSSTCRFFKQFIRASVFGLLYKSDNSPATVSWHMDIIFLLKSNLFEDKQNELYKPFYLLINITIRMVIFNK